MIQNSFKGGKTPFFFFLVLTFSLVSASEFGYNYLDGNSFIWDYNQSNYSITYLNNTYGMFWNNNTFNSTYNLWSYNQTIGAMTYGNATWVPYTGAINNVNLGANSLIVNSTGLASIQLVNASDFIYFKVNATTNRITILGIQFTGVTGSANIVGSTSPTLTTAVLNSYARGGTATTSNLTLIATSVGPVGTSGNIIFSTNITATTEAMRIDRTGNISIGTRLSTMKMDINGSVNVSGIIYANGTEVNKWLYNQTYGWNLSGTNLYPESLDYNVGIGTATPNAKLNVVGKVALGTSFAEGGNSFASGQGSNASGFVSTAMGDSTKAIGVYSTAMGYRTVASTSYGMAMGFYTNSSGIASTAMGDYTNASGFVSTAMGDSTTASGSYSLSTGYLTTASGNVSTAMGVNAIASNNYSIVIGLNPNANTFSSDRTLTVGGNTNITGIIYANGTEVNQWLYNQTEGIDLLNYVPYTGAINNVNLGSYNFSTIGVITAGAEYYEPVFPSKLIVNGTTGFYSTPITNDYIVGSGFGVNYGVYDRMLIRELSSEDLTLATGFAAEAFSQINKGDIPDGKGLFMVGSTFNTNVLKNKEATIAYGSSYSINVDADGNLSDGGVVLSIQQGINGFAGSLAGIMIDDFSRDYIENDLGGEVPGQLYAIYSEGGDVLFNNAFFSVIGNSLFDGNVNVTGDLVVDTDFYCKDDAYITGDLGIGTETPTHKLNLVGSANITQDLIVQGNFTGNQIYLFVYNYSATGFSVTPNGVDIFNNFSGFYNDADNPYGNGIKLITGAPSAGGDKLQVQVDGMYSIDFDSTTDAKTGSQYTFGIANDSAGLLKGRCFTEYGGSGKIESASINCMKRLKAGSNLSLMFKDDANPVQAVTIYKVGIRVVRVGD